MDPGLAQERSIRLDKYDTCVTCRLFLSSEARVDVAAKVLDNKRWRSGSK